jgi:putative RNA 2'-phosphotransferase
MSKHDIGISKFLSLVLRHEPQAIGVSLDEKGWIDVEVLLRAMGTHGKALSFEDLDRLVRESDKQRFAFSDDRQRIRANQGHSVKVDLALEPQTPPELLYHGTPEKFVSSIMETGLNKGQRHHVHLSPDVQTAIKVGERRGRPIILEIRAGDLCRSGMVFYRSENGVWLVDAVPPDFIRKAL